MSQQLKHLYLHSMCFLMLCVMTVNVACGQSSPYSPTTPFLRSFRFSSDGFFRGYDIDSDETAIFRNAPPLEPIKPLTVDELRVPTLSEPRVNRRLIVPGAGTQQTPLLFPFPRTRVAREEEKESVSTAPNTAPPNPRWFRDLGNAPSTQVQQQAVQPAAVVGHSATQVTTPTNTQQINTPQTNSTSNAQSLRQREQQIEISLVTNPAVHLLSPVQVRLIGSTVTLRGVVATEEQKVAAGRIVLAHPAVQEVKNLMTVVPLDP